MNEQEAKKIVVEAGIQLVKSGLIARTWGNISCRVSETHFVITPSGRDYLSLTPEEIVKVSISDLSYQGEIKPSGEKAVHSEIYKNRSECNFVIHTHQENASVISAMGLSEMPVSDKYPLLDNKVLCADYGLPGTKKLQNAIGEALLKSQGKAIIMKNHGVVCYGETMQEAFQVASDLEAASMEFIEITYKNLKTNQKFEMDKLRQFALSKMARKWKGNGLEFQKPCYHSCRTEKGFQLFYGDEIKIQVLFDQPDPKLPKEAAFYQEIYQKNKNINYIYHVDTADITTLSRANITLFPYVDDFAQIIGRKVMTVLKNPEDVAKALKKSSAVFLANQGAFCCGQTQGDAKAVEMILEKNCKIQICGALFPEIKPIKAIDAMLMRFVYQKKYSKQINHA